MAWEARREEQMGRINETAGDFLDSHIRSCTGIYLFSKKSSYFHFALLFERKHVIAYLSFYMHIF